MNGPEFHFLLDAIRFHLHPDRFSGALRNSADHGISWQRVLDLSGGNGVTLLLHRALQETCWDRVPAAARDSLEAFAKRHARRSMVLALETVRVTSQLRRIGVRVAAFKGAVLAQSVYGNLALRQHCDIDLFVPQAELPDAQQALRSLGYATSGDAALSRASPDYTAANGQRTFRHAVNHSRVDLHWEFAPFQRAFPFESADIWAGIRSVSLAGAPVPTLSWEHTAMFLAFHGTKERWRLLKWLCDFSFLVKARPELDWNSILRQCQRRKCARSLLVGVLLASRLLGVEADRGLVSLAAADPGVRKLAEDSIAEEGRRTRRRAPGEAELAEFYYALRTQDRVAGRLALILRLATTLTVSDYAAWSPPRGFEGLLRVGRPFRLAWKAGRSIRASRSNPER